MAAQPTASSTTQRPPRPSLFQLPPSRNASNLSLAPGISNTLPDSSKRSSSKGSKAASVRHGPSMGFLGVSPGFGASFLRPSRSGAEVDAGDAVWDEMQNTLNEVEQAAAGGDHVFGTEHAKALEELRVKQLALAQAWARSEADEAADASASESSMGGVKGASESVGRASIDTKDTSQQKVLDEKTEKDILFARKRREANDRYFERVNSSVLDVVAKLDEVAHAMRAVERESKEIWSESESVNSAMADTQRVP
ncbi:hypothetical protein LOZ66_005145 [Ophidiomyces ophidiicola]|nr:hypothetical protein LOZ65_001729 [Ophidiomyces ophidiicola]KAI1935605.1 hypothetical protein LOZ66_005145 [Ophidiomyces ophidiicola]